jgi:hypothetical protein
MFMLLKYSKDLEEVKIFGSFLDIYKESKI